jgi:hypothetical protein
MGGNIFPNLTRQLTDEKTMALNGKSATVGGILLTLAVSTAGVLVTYIWHEIPHLYGYLGLGVCAAASLLGAALLLAEKPKQNRPKRQLETHNILSVNQIGGITAHTVNMEHKGDE